MNRPGSADRPPVDAVLVVVPARDEEELLGRCLLGLARARARLARVHPGVACHTVVVLDGCTDGSAAVAAAHDCAALEVQLASVGAARALGAQWGRRAAGDGDPRATWLATTDADSEVPEDWLTGQVEAADAGADLVLGRVRPDPSGAPRALLDAWHVLDRGLARRHRVHGANLGVRLAAHDRAGGFQPVTEHEDVRLVAALRRLGVAEAQAPAVLTSARRWGRTPGGFAGYLRGLEPGGGGVPRAVPEAPPLA